ncbi:hypothetical protein B0H63DRAFT_188229 [Podospora didyma]|uniref:NWD NACHT-NTPase N-terminal domain-containing protein n=1 Tax=Podospora didyma TaxID=330526 RepID=A0AAE0NQG5_9PEZI|nr:hypothetical protein B0H63DRAFT_188229 [Podospora didyma]
MMGRFERVKNFLRKSKAGTPFDDAPLPTSNGKNSLPGHVSSANNNATSLNTTVSFHNTDDDKRQFAITGRVLASPALEKGSPPTPREAPPTRRKMPASLWDRAYDILRKEDRNLVDDYETLLQRGTEEMDKGLSRQARLDAILERGVQRMEKTVLENQIAEASKLVLWAKDWIGEAVTAAPEAAVAWAGVCLVLPLLVKPQLADEAQRDGFAYVTTRMRYYAALEPLLLRLGQNPGADKVLMAEASAHIADLYRYILEFQMRSALRFCRSRLGRYAGDVIRTDIWKQLKGKIESLDRIVNQNLIQINSLVSRQELESLNKTSKEYLSVMEKNLDLKEAERREKVLQMFRLTDNRKDATYEWYKDRVEDRVEGTCQWFLGHQNFKTWLGQDSGPLLISADPGCGKSVLAKYLIDRVLPGSGATICYFFFKDQDQNTVRQALCAILHQLFSQNPDLIKHAMEPFSRNGQGLANSTLALFEILKSAVADDQAGPVTVVLDALDECLESEFEDLTKTIQQQFQGGTQPGCTRLKYLLTSRPYEQVLSGFRNLSKNFPYVRIPGEEESETISREVNHVIKHRVRQLAEQKGLSEHIRIHLQEKLLEIPHRTYLWVYLIFDYLKVQDFKKTPKGVESAIAVLPKTVGDAYEQILKRSQNPTLALRALCFVLVAKRPLTLSEMNVAVNIEVHTTRSLGDLDLEDDNDFKSTLRSCCGLFVSIHHGKIYFLHQTAREFLLAQPFLVATGPTRTMHTHTKPPDTPPLHHPTPRWQHSVSIVTANKALAQVCVIYLDFLYPKDEGKRFLKYSGRYWADHFRMANNTDSEGNDPIVASVVKICEPSRKEFSAWWQLGFIDSISNSDGALTSLMVTSCLGCTAAVKVLLASEANLEAKDRRGQTALALAALHAQAGVVQQLLAAGANTEARDDDGETPLFRAVSSTHNGIVWLLIDGGSNVQAKDDNGRTPLFLAAKEGYLEMDDDGQTPLHLAISFRNWPVIGLLIENGANLEAEDKDGETPADLVTKYNLSAALDLAAEKEAKIEGKKDGGLAALRIAALKRKSQGKTLGPSSRPASAPDWHWPYEAVDS